MRTASPIVGKKRDYSERIQELLTKMNLTEKIGQMSQFAGQGGIPDHLRSAIQEGKVGSILNQVGVETLNEIQRIAVEESRLGIPLIIGRDVIHGFQTMMPIPLGQAASWNPELVRKGARVAATEAAREGINWTFAPMVDITRDPRWGRIAESLGEDPYLASKLGAAMVKGFQGDDLSSPDSIAACAKHFAGYGYSEAGIDYAYVNISENEMRNVVFPPFKACVDAGAATFMTAFSDINGVPATANEFINRRVLRDEWGFEGFVVSDWDSVIQLITHGFSANEKEAAREAVQAGVDMEMASHTYLQNLEALVEEGRISMNIIDKCVENILKVKFRLGLFDNPYTHPELFPQNGNPKHLQVAKEAAIQSCVLLKNDYQTLPLKRNKVRKIGIIGPMADDGFEQMGTWTFDGVEEWCQTPLQAIREKAGDDIEVHYINGLDTTRSKSHKHFDETIALASQCDTLIMFMGEEAILSGEAHCRADINLPGAQNDLLKRLSKLGKSTILVVMAGRPITLETTHHYVNSLLYAWHPGTMAGPAIAELLFGEVSPSGKLPVSFPKMVGQIPIYYNRRNSGKPASPESFTHIDHIPQRATQTSVGNTAFHLDAGYEPLYPFGYGLSYAHFEYYNLRQSSERFSKDETLTIEVEVHNSASHEGTEVVQLYIRDVVGNITRPIKELKGFQRVPLDPGQTQTVKFEIRPEDLAFYNRHNQLMIEAGTFYFWVGGHSNAELGGKFELID
jgi:beta-glucosidase